MVDHHQPDTDGSELSLLIESVFQRALAGDMNSRARLLDFLGMTEKPYADYHYSIADKLCHLNESAGFEYFKARLTQSESFDREATYYLAKHGDRKALDKLADAYTGNPRGQSARCDKFALPELMKLFDVGSLDDTSREDARNALVKCFSGDIDALTMMRDRVYYTWRDEDIDDVFETILALDERGEHITISLFPLLNSPNDLIRRKVAAFIQSNYLDTLDIETVAILEANYDTAEAQQVMYRWLSQLS